MAEVDNDSPRATVALAVEKIDGLKELTRAEFGDVKERLGKLEGLPERVAGLEARMTNTEADVKTINDARADVPTRIVAGLALVAAIASAVAAFVN